MRINEKGTNIEIGPEIKSYLYKKLDHLQKFIDHADESVLCEVELGKISNHHKKGDVFRTEINLHIAGKNFRAESETEDLFSSIDIAKDDLVRALQTHKDKKVSFLRRSGIRAKNIIKGIFIKE